MLNKAFIAAFILIIFSGCKKELNDVSEDENYDVVNNFFRVIARSNSDYTVSITQVHSSNSTTNTFNTAVSNGFEFNYGFPAQTGDKISVDVISPKGTTINSTILYKNVKVGGDNVTQRSDGGVELKFDYTVQ